VPPTHNNDKVVYTGYSLHRTIMHRPMQIYRIA